MFGMGFWEIVMIVIVAIVVIGPKDLPKVLRRLGQYAGKLRRMAADLRSQSGIDDALRMEGLSDDINEIRKLARGELDGVERSITERTPEDRAKYDEEMKQVDASLFRAREYPRDGADSFGAIPDAAAIDYELPPSPLARDPLYVTGDVNGVLPDLPEPAVATTEAEPAPTEGETDGTAAAATDEAAANGEASPEIPSDKPDAAVAADAEDTHQPVQERSS
jgi:sec-independent protein translocase protein TatB